MASEQLGVLFADVCDSTTIYESLGDSRALASINRLFRVLIEKVEAVLHPCRAARHHELDFWVGSWDVKNAAGQAVGTSQVYAILDGCVVLENWTGRFGDTGKSFNLYDPAKKRWQQTWVSDRAVLTEFHGALEGGAMVYETTSPMPNGVGGRRRLCAGSGTVPVRPDLSVDVVETRDPALLEIAAKSVADAFLA